DSDGGAKTVENPKRRLGGNFIYLNMKSKKFIEKIRKMLIEDFKVVFFIVFRTIGESGNAVGISGKPAWIPKTPTQCMFRTLRLTNRMTEGKRSRHSRVLLEAMTTTNFGSIRTSRAG